MPPVRILIADDYPAVRQAIRRLLAAEPEWEIVAEATDGREAVRLACDFKPDLAVLDMAMPGLSGIEATRQIARAMPGIRILLLTIHDDEAYVSEAWEAGAHGYVLKEAADSDLVRAVEAIIRDRRFVSSVLPFAPPARDVPASR